VAALPTLQSIYLLPTVLISDWCFAFDGCIDSSNEDDTGKTVAIIVGVLAGIAVIIVLLSVCRKAAGKIQLSSLQSQ